MAQAAGRFIPSFSQLIDLLAPEPLNLTEHLGFSAYQPPTPVAPQSLDRKYPSNFFFNSSLDVPTSELSHILSLGGHAADEAQYGRR